MKIIDRTREKIWFEPFPAVGMKAVTLWRVGPFRRILYRDFDGTCGKEFGWISFIPRT